MYGIRYTGGAAGMFVLDGQFAEVIHADESVAAGPEGQCALLASFTGLDPRVVHNLTVIVPSVGDPAFTFTIGNVTTDVSRAAAEAQAIRQGDGSAKGPPLAAIVVPALVGLLLLFGGLFFVSKRLNRKRRAKKSPSAVFLAEHPELASYHSRSRGGRSVGTTGSVTLVSPDPSFFRHEKQQAHRSPRPPPPGVPRLERPLPGAPRIDVSSPQSAVSSPRTERSSPWTEKSPLGPLRTGPGILDDA